MNTIEQEHIDFMTTPGELQVQVFERENCPLHYWTAGPADRPAIALLHGATMDHRMFNAQIPLLAEDYRLLVWDARGHGKSQPLGLRDPDIEDYAEDALAMLAHAGVEQAILIGQSMGAYIAQHLARLHPERLKALVVIGATPVGFAVPALEVSALRMSAGMFAVWPYGSLKRMMARYTSVDARVQRYALAAMDQLDRSTLLTVWKAVSSAIRREGYPDLHIDVPFLLTHGAHDVTGTIRRDAPRWAASDPRIRYEVIPDAGHNANQDNPAYFNRLLMEFLEGIE